MKINRRGLFSGAIAAALGGQSTPLSVTFGARPQGVCLAHPDALKAFFAGWSEEQCSAVIAGMKAHREQRV